MSLLFVQDAQGVAFDNGTMSLKNAKPQVLYFSDRPHCTAGHLTCAEAMDIVSGSFKNSPPNAVLVIFREGKSTDVVMTLVNARRIDGDDLVFSGIKIIQGTMPASGGPNALFIDTVPGPRGPR